MRNVQKKNKLLNIGSFPLRVWASKFLSIILENMKAVILPGPHFKFSGLGLVIISRPQGLSRELLRELYNSWLTRTRVLGIPDHRGRVADCHGHFLSHTCTTREDLG